LCFQDQCRNKFVNSIPQHTYLAFIYEITHRDKQIAYSQKDNEEWSKPRHTSEHLWGIPVHKNGSCLWDPHGFTTKSKHTGSRFLAGKIGRS